MAAVNLSSSVALLEKSTAAAKGVPSSSSSCSSSSIQGLPVLGRRHAHGRQRPLLVRGSAGKAPARRGAPIRTNAVATAPSTGVATWRSSGTSQAVPPAWSVLSEELSMGPCPRSPRDLDVLLANTKTTALLFLETEDGCDKLGLDWGKFRERASQKGLMAVRISMRDGDYQDQAAALPEAVRAVASLVALGYKVHVCCTSGVDRSPLVALGYLTFVKGMEFTDAVEIISANNQAAQPHFESWEEAKTRMAAGDLKRVSALAHEVAQHRVAAKQPGTPADDWLTAQQLLVAEAFDRGVATDVTLTEAISRVTRLEANRALEELAAFKANAEKAMEAANSSRDRLEFFNRQLQSLKDKEAEARLAMNAAVKDKEGLARQVQTLKLSEGSATKSAAEAREALAAATERVRGLEQREAEARAAAESATSKARDLALQVEKLRHAEAVARKELHGAKAKADFVATKLSSMEASLKEAQRAKDAANDRVKELLKNITSASTSPSDAKTLASKITELSSMETAASAAASIAKERVEFFQRQVIALKEREDATKELAQEALAKVSKLGEELEMTARREASAKEQVALLKTEVAQLSKQLQSLQMQGNTATAAASTGTASTDQTAEVQRLLAELEAAQKKASKATDAATYAQDQVQFFLRRIELLKEKEEKATKQAEERMAAFEARVVGKAQREIAERTAAVVKEMSAEVEAAKKISSKSLEQASTAKEQVQFFQRRMEMLKEREEKSKVATDARIRTFTLQVSELREKLAAADKAAAEADQKITNLSSQVAKLEVKEMAAIEAAKAAGAPNFTKIKNDLKRKAEKQMAPYWTAAIRQMQVQMAKAVLGSVLGRTLVVAAPRLLR